MSSQQIEASRQTRLSVLMNRLNLKQLGSVVFTSSLIFKSFSVAILVGYVLTTSININDYLSVVPGKLLPPNMFVWTLLTHSFVERRFIDILADCFILLLYTKMLEPMWGRLECLRFYVIMTSVVALTTALFYFAMFALTFDEHFLFNRYIYGQGGLWGAFSVAMKQVMPDSILIDFSFLRLKQDNLPLLLVFVSFLLYIISLADHSYFIMVTLGVLYGWIYLRFFQKHNKGMRGDSSSSFVFASLFPARLQPCVAIFANTVFNMLVRLKICKAQPKRYNVSSSFGGSSSSVVSSSSNQPHITITIPLITQSGTGSGTTVETNADAERRRSKALKALKERLKKPGDDETGEQLKMVTADWISTSPTDNVAVATTTTSSIVSETTPTDPEQSML